MDHFYPPLEPFNHGMLQVSDLHTIYYEEAGNPEGRPVLFIHGGPGGGIMPLYRQFFNPQHYRIVLVDQRGCGKSTPHAELEENNTQNLIADFELLRNHLGIERWQLFGGSWGSTLALAYAQAHPQVVTEMVLRGIFLGDQSGFDWIFQSGAGAAELFPDYWEEYIAPVPEAERGDLVKAYYRMLTSEDEVERLRAATAFARWEMSISSLHVNQKARARAEQDAHFSAAFARLECYYMINHCFLKPNQIIDNISKIQHIPGRIVQGRYDVVCPASAAWKLHRAWNGSQLDIIPDAGHSTLEPGIVKALIAATDYFAEHAEY